MLPEDNPRLFFVLLLGFLVVVLSITSACERISTPTSQIPIPITNKVENLSRSAQAVRTDWISNSLKSNSVRFEHLMPEQGLSQSTVTCILQDSRGFMWFGTEDGLNKYDGYTFTVYKHNPGDSHSLSDDHILSIYEDQTGVIWIGTQKGGLNQFDFSSQQFTNHPMNSVRSILEDRQGRLWIGTSDGLFTYDRQRKRLIRHRYGNVNAIFEDHLGEIWIGTSSRGLERFGPNQVDPIVYRLKPGDPDSISNDTVLSIEEDQHGAIWIGTNGEGLDRFNRDTSHFEHYRKSSQSSIDSGTEDILPNNIVWSIKEDRFGNLWVGTEIGGLVLFEPERSSSTHFQNNPGDPFSLSSDIVRSIYEDRSGIIWIGTVGGGVNKLDKGNGFTHYRHIPNNQESLSDNFVTSILATRSNQLWIGTMHGLDCLDQNRGTWRHFKNIPNDPESLSNDLITALYEDPTGVLWVGSIDGLDRFNHQNETFSRFPINAPRSMTADNSGFLWIGADEGLYRLDPRLGEIRRVRSGSVQVIHRDRLGLLWMGRTGYGLSRFNPETALFKHYHSNPDDPRELSDDYVTAISEDELGNLWIGTHGGGLNYFDRFNEVFSRYREKDGIPSDTVAGILEDQLGNLWISTNMGLSKFNPKSRLFRNYDASDGLQCNEFNIGAFYKSREGEMFFGGINGLNAFDPEQIMENQYIPPVIITTLQLFNHVISQDLSDNQTVRLTYQENFISFDFAALDFTAPEKNQYAFKMEGLDKDWIYPGTRRHADYPNLREGDYIFRVKASNNDGVWNEVGTALRVIVSPPFWNTWWFKGILAICMLGGIFTAYQLRIRSIKSHIQEQSKIVEQERSRLARDLHDSVTQSLYGVKLYAQAVAGQIALGDTDRANEHLNELQDVAQDALVEMRLLIHELRPSILEEQGLLAALQARLLSVERRAGLKVELKGDLESRLPANIEEGLYRISQEALNNTLKHAHAHNIMVYLHQEQHTIILEINDDGVGFEPDGSHLQGGIGIAAIEERIEQLRGQMILESAPGQGTHLVVKLPI